ncbi:MAG: ATP-dependent DNA helicase [Propionicimonas sp.]
MTLRRPEELAELLGIPFSEQQLAAIAAPLEPGVIIAGAGSGKTTVMAARVVWLVGSGAVRPEQVLGLTFTRKAAGELSSRVRRALIAAGLADSEGEELVLTYDAFAARLVNEHGLLLGIEPGARLITGAARFRLAARVVADPPAPLRALSRLRPDSITQRVVELAGELRSHLVEPDDLVAHAQRFVAELAGAPTWRGQMYAALAQASAAAEERIELAGLVTAYEELKQRYGYVEFADQMAQAARLATEVPAVAQALRQEFAVVLLDEYQDTSAAQARLLAGLFSGPDADHGRGYPVTAVGDPCQAIYTWRGAAASNILRFADEFPAADGSRAPVFALTVNRRSGQRILDAANQLAEPIRSDPALAGLELALSCPPQTPPARLEVAEFDTWPAERGWIADQVVAEHDSGQVEAWSQIAVLARRNATVAALYTELTARGVPAEIVGLGGLLELPAIAEVVATLRLLADPADNPALVRLLTSPRWAIGLADLELLGRRAVQLAGRTKRGTEPDLDEALVAVLAGGDQTAVPSLLEALAAVAAAPPDPASEPSGGGLSPAAVERFAAFAAEFTGLRRWASESVVDLVSRVIDTLGLEVELLAEGADPGQLAAFVQAVAGYSEIDGEASLGGLLAWFEAEREYGVGLEQAVISDDDSVKLLTVHRAKGLEWEVVFLPALATDVFPTDRVTGNWLRNAASLPHPLRGDADAVPQLRQTSNDGFKQFASALTADQRLSEDRLAYVAVTRAKRRLYASSHAWDAQLVRPRRASDYLRVLAEHADAAQAPTEFSDTNPLAVEQAATGWPVVDGSQSWRRRQAAAALVAAVGSAPSVPPPADLDLAAELADWQRWRQALTVQARADATGRRQAVAPPYLSVTGVSRLLRDPAGYSADLLRPMPRLVDEAQRSGTGFHRWLEQRYAAQAALADDLEVELAEVDEGMRAAFLAGPYADQVPVAVEVPFTIAVPGRLVRGRIDAVFPGTGRFRYQVVDWKTGWAGRADPVQLAWYRLAWAELAGVPPEQVEAVFYEVATGRVLRPSLPERDRLEALLAGALA